jgi:hypothetical protein
MKPSNNLSCDVDEPTICGVFALYLMEICKCYHLTALAPMTATGALIVDKRRLKAFEGKACGIQTVAFFTASYAGLSWVAVHILGSKCSTLNWSGHLVRPYTHVISYTSVRVKR